MDMFDKFVEGQYKDKTLQEVMGQDFAYVQVKVRTRELVLSQTAQRTFDGLTKSPKVQQKHIVVEHEIPGGTEVPNGAENELKEISTEGTKLTGGTVEVIGAEDTVTENSQVTSVEDINITAEETESNDTTSETTSKNSELESFEEVVGQEEDDIVTDAGKSNVTNTKKKEAKHKN
jgi:hypothetical protein